MIVASNFKTNHNRQNTKEFVDFINSQNYFSEVRIFPPFTALNNFELTPNIRVGAQNFYPVQNGSFTGEIGFDQLEEFEVESLLVGHSERRHVLGESQESICAKYDFAKAKDCEIVYCVGEPKEIREQGIDTVMSYIWKQFDGIDTNYDELVVAYEPVWAIGTGLSASLADIKEVLSHLREKIKAPLLYGGSVKVATTKDILEIENCDGILVGTASWDVNNFSKMIEIADNL